MTLGIHRWCPVCGGWGLRPPELQNVDGSLKVVWTLCRACGGHGSVFGPPVPRMASDEPHVLAIVKGSGPLATE